MLYLYFGRLRVPHDDVLNYATVILSYAFHPTNATWFIPSILTHYALKQDSTKTITPYVTPSCLGILRYSPWHFVGESSRLLEGPSAAPALVSIFPGWPHLEPSRSNVAHLSSGHTFTNWSHTVAEHLRNVLIDCILPVLVLESTA